MLNFFLLSVHCIQLRLKCLVKNNHHPKLFRVANRMDSGRMFLYFTVIPNTNFLWLSEGWDWKYWAWMTSLAWAVPPSLSAVGSERLNQSSLHCGRRAAEERGVWGEDVAKVANDRHRTGEAVFSRVVTAEESTSQGELVTLSGGHMGSRHLPDGCCLSSTGVQTVPLRFRARYGQGAQIQELLRARWWASRQTLFPPLWNSFWPEQQGSGRDPVL